MVKVRDANENWREDRARVDASARDDVRFRLPWRSVPFRVRLPEANPVDEQPVQARAPSIVRWHFLAGFIIVDRMINVERTNKQNFLIILLKTGYAKD